MGEGGVDVVRVIRRILFHCIDYYFDTYVFVCVCVRTCMFIVMI